MALTLGPRGAGLFLVAALIAVAPSARGQLVADEYQIKAAFLPNFVKFIEWPNASLGPTGSTVVIGIVGDDPFGDALRQAIYLQTAGGHPLEVRHFRWNEPLDGCRVLFIAASEVTHVSQILAAVAGAGVLTVADFDSFARRGGMIEFRTINHRVRFDVNSAVATAAGLRISSKLLTLAVHVYTQPMEARR